MRVFVDECVTVAIMSYLKGHDFIHISDTPWLGLNNGELLRTVESSFDVFLTTDRQLPYQQNLRTLDLIVVIMRGLSNKIEDLLPLVPETLILLNSIRESEARPDAVYEINPS